MLLHKFLDQHLWEIKEAQKSAPLKSRISISVGRLNKTIMKSAKTRHHMVW